MFKRLRKIKGQSTLEYAVIIAVVIAAVLAMQIYARRALMGGIRDDVDNVGKQFDPGFDGSVTYTRSGSTADSYTAETGVTSSSFTADSLTVDGTEGITDYEHTWFPEPE